MNQQDAIRKAQEAEQKFQQELQEFQEQTNFPQHSIFPDFNKYKRIVLGMVAPSTLKASIQEWENLYEKTENYNLLEMGTLLNIMESRSMKSLELTKSEYVKYQMEIGAMAVEFANILQPKVNSLKRKHQALARIATPNKSIALP